LNNITITGAPGTSPSRVAASGVTRARITSRVGCPYRKSGPDWRNRLARAHRWKRILDGGRYGSVSEMAEAEKFDRGCLGRILMLTLLAPDIVQAIMDGRQPAVLGVHVLREGFPVEWGEQRRVLVARQPGAVMAPPQSRARCGNFWPTATP
jgi:hypothetical protein